MVKRSPAGKSSKRSKKSQGSKRFKKSSPRRTKRSSPRRLDKATREYLSKAYLDIQYKGTGPWNFPNSTFPAGWLWNFSDAGSGPGAKQYPQEVGYNGPPSSLRRFREKVEEELENLKQAGVIVRYKIKTGLNRDLDNE